MMALEKRLTFHVDAFRLSILAERVLCSASEIPDVVTLDLTDVKVGDCLATGHFVLRVGL